MSISSRKKLPFNTPPANASELASQLTQQQAQQPRPICTWSAHAPPPGPSPLPFPRSSHTLTWTATAAGELLLFGGYVDYGSSDDLYVISTRDFSTILLQTSGEAPSPRGAHYAALIGTNLLIWGGKMSPSDRNARPLDISLYLLNLVSREWIRFVINGPGPNALHNHTTTVVGSKLFVFGGEIGGETINDMWTLDLDRLKSQPLWESYEPTPGNKKPLPRFGHVSVTTEDRIIIFGGVSNLHYYNDTWSFDISTRNWTELQCTGSIPSPRLGHAAVLVDGVMYVFGGYSLGEGYLDDLYSLQLSTLRWFKFHNVGPSPHGRSAHAMASDGTRVFVLGGYSRGALSDEMSLIHVFDTKYIKYPELEPDALNPNEKTTQLAQKSSTGPPTEEQPQDSKFSSSDPHGTFRLQSATPAISGCPASQITHEQNPCSSHPPLELTGVNDKPRHVPEDDVSDGSTEYPKFATPHSSFEGEVTTLELERQLSLLLVAKTERDQRIAQLTNELTLKSALLGQAEANAVGVAMRAGPELREHAEDRPLMRTSSMREKGVEPADMRMRLRDMQARLRDMQAKLDESLLSRDQQIGQYEKELANVRAKLEANESELEAVRLRLTDAEKSLTKSKAEADISRAQSATGSVNRDEVPVAHGLLERVRALEVEMASKRWDEKSIEEMECRNEG